MNLEINQSNLYLLLPSKVAWMAEWLSEDKDIGIVEAIKMIYYPLAELNQCVLDSAYGFVVNVIDVL